MTLILTELSPFGIAMAADSAVTFSNTRTGLSFAQPNVAKKLQPIPYLRAGISCWGMGEISGISTDQWVSNFIDSNSSLTTLQGFAEELADQLNSHIPPNTTAENRLGFHLAAFEDYNGALIPSFYHIHDGPSTVLTQRGSSIDPKKFNANHDMPPQIFLQTANSGKGWITRNGDYQLYAEIFGLLEELFQQLLPLGIIIPNSQNLNDRAEYLVFQIRTVAEIYRLSNLIPGIGGGINYLTISQSGIYSQGVRFF